MAIEVKMFNNMMNNSDFWVSLQEKMDELQSLSETH